MKTLELNEQTFENTIKDNDLVLIDFWAPWCGPCKMFGPVFEKVAENYDNVVFAKCNVDEQAELASVFGVRSIPTVVGLKKGEVIFSNSGALSEAGFDKVVKDILAK